MTKDNEKVDDDGLIARITETYGLRDYGGDVAELVRRYRQVDQAPPATQVAADPEKPVATTLRGSTGPSHPPPPSIWARVFRVRSTRTPVL